MSVPNHLDIVTHAAAVQPAAHTVEGALAFLLRVIDVLPMEERAGLLLKPSGENIWPYRGQMVSNSRLCYPDGQLYKILTDVPTTNGPQWADDGTVDPSRYLAVTQEPPPPPPDPPTDNREIIARLDALTSRVETALSLLNVLADRPWPEYTAPIPALSWPFNTKAGTLVLKPKV